MLYPHIFRRARLCLYCKTLTDESPPFDLKRWHFEVIYNALHSFRLKFLFFKGRISYHSSNKGHLWRNYMLYLIYICYASFLRILQYGTNHVTRSVSDESRHVMKYLCLRKFMVNLVCYSQTGMRRCSFLMYQLHIYLCCIFAWRICCWSPQVQYTVPSDNFPYQPTPSYFPVAFLVGWGRSWTRTGQPRLSWRPGPRSFCPWGPWSLRYQVSPKLTSFLFSIFLKTPITIKIHHWHLF